MHDQDTKNQTKVQKETNFRMMHTSPWIYITINTQTGTTQIRRDIPRDRQPDQNKKQNHNGHNTEKYTATPYRPNIFFFFLYFQDQNTYKNEKVQRTEGNKLKKRRYGHNAEIAI